MTDPITEASVTPRTAEGRALFDDVRICIFAIEAAAFAQGVAAARAAVEATYEEHRTRNEVTEDGDRYTVLGSTKRWYEALLAALATVTPDRPTDSRELVDVERLAVALNTAQLDPSEISPGRDLRIPAARIARAYTDDSDTRSVTESEGGS